MIKNLTFFLTPSCSSQGRVIPPVRILKHWSAYMVDLATFVLTDEMEFNLTDCVLDTSSKFNVNREILECIFRHFPGYVVDKVTLRESGKLHFITPIQYHYLHIEYITSCIHTPKSKPLTSAIVTASFTDIVNT